MSSTEGLPQKQLICGAAEELGPVVAGAGADRGAVWGVARDVDGGGREVGCVGFGPGAGAKSTGSGGTAPQSASG